MLNVTTHASDSSLVIELEGRLDSATSPDLRELLRTSLEGVEHLTFDFKNLEYVSSAGLSIILTTQKTMLKQGDMKVVNVSDAVMEIFEVTGFSDILTIE